MNKVLIPGSFDPITLGHMDIINRSLKLFDEVEIAIMENPHKTSLFSMQERKDRVELCVKDLDIKVTVSDGLTVNQAAKRGCNIILRGIRSASDYEYEKNMMLVNRAMNNQIETIFLESLPEYAHISSSTVREIMRYGGDISSFVPKVVVDYILEHALSKRF